jgi:O-antigen/teichoic acid export membrane protein
MLKKIILNSGIQIIGRGIGLVFSVLLTGVLSRRLGVTGYGNYILITALINLLITTANWGTQIIGVRELSRTKNKGQLIGSLGLLRFYLSLITSILAVTAIVVLPAFTEIRTVSLLVIPIIFTANFSQLFNIIFQTKLRMDLKTTFQIIDQIVLFCLTLFLLNQGLELSAPLIAILAAKLITSLLAYSKARKFIAEKIRINKEIFKKIALASIPLGAQLTLFTAYDQAVDSFLIKNYLGAGQVGFYGLAYKIYSNLVLPAYYLNNTILPILSSKNKQSKKGLVIGSLLTAGGIIFVAPITFLFSNLIIQLIAGSAFSVSSQILRILSLSLIFAYFNHLTGFYLIAKDKQVDSLIISAVGLIWNLILNLIFIPTYGISAAAWITVSTEGLITIISTWKLIKCYNKR